MVGNRAGKKLGFPLGLEIELLSSALPESFPGEKAGSRTNWKWGREGTPCKKRNDDVAAPYYRIDREMERSRTPCEVCGGPSSEYE